MENTKLKTKSNRIKSNYEILKTNQELAKKIKIKHKKCTKIYIDSLYLWIEIENDRLANKDLIIKNFINNVKCKI